MAVTANGVSTPATTKRSVRAATEFLATDEFAPGLFRVDNGKLGDDHEQYVVEPDLPACSCGDWEHRSEKLGADGCKHIRRVRILQGEIDISPLLEADDLRIDPLLLKQLGVNNE